MSKADKNTKAHPLWAEEYWLLKAFFEDDPTICVGDPDISEIGHYCTITTNDSLKAKYLEELLNLRELIVHIECENEDVTNNQKLGYLCKDNPIFHDVITIRDEDLIKFEAVEFKPICIHYYSDDLSSPTGHTAILPWQLAKALFSGNKINFQTHLEEDEK